MAQQIGDSTSVRAVEIVAFGRVQGVGFRWQCLMEAQRLGLVGWVTNKSDGSVKIFAQGDSAAVEQLMQWANSDPGFIRVDRLNVQEVEPAQFTKFSVR